MNKLGIAFLVATIFTGLMLLFIPYKAKKKDIAFQKMSLEIVDNESKKQINMVEDYKSSETNNKNNEEKDEKNSQIIKPNSNNIQNNSTKTEQNVEKYLGILKIPKISLENGFYDKNSKYNNVNKNVIIIKQSNYPDENLGNVILAAHNGNATVSYFRNLDKLSVNDVAYINYKNVEYKYKLVNTYTQPKTGNLIIYRNNEKSTLTLITCTKNSKTTQTIYIFERV